MLGFLKGAPSALLLLAMLSASAPTTAKVLYDGRIRAGLIAGYRAVMGAWDKDNDGRLSRAEWAGMVDAQEAIAAKTNPTSTSQQLRSLLMDHFQKMDSDADGLVTLEELLREPLRTFTCMDASRDDTLSEAEITSRMSRCASDPQPSEVR